MKKIDLGQMITILANVGVIAGIVFLAVELRQNNSFLEAQAGYALVQNRANNNALLRSSPEFASLLAKLDSGAELSPAEKIREIGFYQLFLINWEWEFREFQAGRLDEEQIPIQFWRALMHGEGPIPTPGLMDYWDSLKASYDSDFVDYLDTRVIQER